MTRVTLRQKAFNWGLVYRFRGFGHYHGKELGGMPGTGEVFENYILIYWLR